MQLWTTLLLSIHASPRFLLIFCILILYQDTRRKECPFPHFQVLFSSCPVQCPLCICKAIFLPFSCHFQLPGSRRMGWFFLSVNIFVDKIAQQTDKPLSGSSQFLVTSHCSRCLCTSGCWSLGSLCLDSRIQGDVFMKFPPPHALIASLPLCCGEICWHFLGGCWFWFIFFPLKAGRRGRGSAGQR